MNGYPVGVSMTSDKSPRQKHMVMAMTKPIVPLIPTDQTMDTGTVRPASSTSSADPSVSMNVKFK